MKYLCLQFFICSPENEIINWLTFFPENKPRLKSHPSFTILFVNVVEAEAVDVAAESAILRSKCSSQGVIIAYHKKLKKCELHPDFAITYSYVQVLVTDSFEQTYDSNESRIFAACAQ